MDLSRITEGVSKLRKNLLQSIIISAALILAVLLRPDTGFGAAVDADKVDGFDASLTPTASTILPLDGNIKFPNSVLNTGSGNGLNADMVDDLHASAIPVANLLLALDSNAKLPNSVLYMGSGNGLDADTLDGLHATSFVQQGQANSVTGVMLTDNSVGTLELSDNAVTGLKIQNVTRVITANLMGYTTETFASFPFGIRTLTTGQTAAIYTFAVPYDYVGGDLTIREWWRIHDNFGTAAIFRWASRQTTDGQDLGIVSGEPFYITADAGWGGQRIWTFPTSWGFSAGDIIEVWMERRGDLPEDNAGRLDLRAVAVDYTAEQ